MSTRYFLIGCAFAAVSAAGENKTSSDDLKGTFNDLVTDLGPLLALFGESMAKQFLSESLTFSDYIIFAMAPIGLLTALVSAIRLCGSASTRAFIGRSQEGEGVVEAELCTSTSRDVCELFTRGGIQRVLGRPNILELVYIPCDENVDKQSSKPAIKKPLLFISRDYFKNRGSTGSFPWREVKSSILGGKDNASLAPNPNLSLNIGIKRPPKAYQWALATVALILQLGVIALAGAGGWRLGWSDVRHAPPLFIAGTVLMCLGMGLCAALIGQTTQEVRFRRVAQEHSQQPRLLWLQPGPQVIGDQSFDSFAYLEDTKLNPLKTWISSKKTLMPHSGLYTNIAVVISVSGYVMQFVGSRGMEAWVALAQLIVTVIMSILRGALRTQRLGRDDNAMRELPDMVAGHELDWMAFKLDPHTRFDPQSGLEIPSWHLTGRHFPAQREQAPERKSDLQGSDTSNEDQPEKSPHEVEEASLTMSGATVSVADARSTLSSFSSEAGDSAFQIRLRLANLTGLESLGCDCDYQYQQWDDKRVAVRATARKLSAAMGLAATNLFSQIKTHRDIILQVEAASPGNTRTRQLEQVVRIALKPPPEFSQVGWRLDTVQVEAILGLWLWTLAKDQHSFSSNDDSAEYEGSDPRVSRADQIPVGRMMSLGADENWEAKTNIQGEMDLWLGHSAVKFHQDTVILHQQEPYGLVTHFYKPEGESPGQWQVLKPNGTHTQLVGKQRQDTRINRQRFCGWNIAQSILYAPARSAAPRTVPDKAAESTNQAITARVQYTQIAVTSNQDLLNICCQELYVALMMSLIEAEGAPPMADPTFVEDSQLLRLEHPTVSIFADAFVEGGLGSYSNALLCIVPALRKNLPSLDSETMLSTLLKTATKYRHEMKWGRAEVALRWACARMEDLDSSGQHFEHTLRALCELYRFALATFSESEQKFGLSGIKWVVEKYDSRHKSGHDVKDIVDCYRMIARRFRASDADGTRKVECSKRLGGTIEHRNRGETLYNLCMVAPGEVPTRALAFAARNNWPEVVSGLLEMGAEPDDCDGFRGETGLFYCAQRGHETCASILIDHGASVDLGTEEGSPLLQAAKHGHANIVKLLLKTGLVDLNSQDSRRDTPLTVAARNGHVEVVKLLLADGINKVDRTGQAFDLAAEKGHADIVKLILDTGHVGSTYSGLLKAADGGHADVFKLLFDERMSGAGLKDLLLMAARHGYVDILNILLKAENINVDVTDDNNRTPLSWATSGGHQEAVKLLLKHGADLESKDEEDEQTPLAWAAHEGRADVVRELLEQGANKDVQNVSRETPLMLATLSMYRNPSTPPSASAKAVVSLLLGARANVELKNHLGMSVLAQSALKGQKEAMELLLDYGAELESRSNTGMTPLMWAASDAQEGTLQMLLEKGADVEAKTSSGQTTLMYAAECRRGPEVLQRMLNTNADTEARDKEGRTALLYAVRKGVEENVRMLLMKNVDIEAKDKNGRTALMHAAVNGYAEIVKMLLSSGAQDKAVDTQNRTALTLARESGRPDAAVIQILESYNGSSDA